MDKVKEFMKELSKLSIKYDLYIDACGCCNSPWICKPGCERSTDIVATSLYFDDKEKQYKADLKFEEVKADDKR